MDQSEQWMYEYIIQYLESPMWKTGVQDLMDRQCEAYENSDSGVQDKVFKEYLGVVDSLEGELRAGLGIDDSKFRSMIKVGVKIKNYGVYFQELMLIRDQEVFAKKMVNRNKELEMQAVMQISEGNDSTALERMELEQQARDLDLALKMSLALENDLSAQNGQEDKDMLAAINNSFQTLSLEKEKHDVMHNLPPLKQSKQLYPLTRD